MVLVYCLYISCIVTSLKVTSRHSIIIYPYITLIIVTKKLPSLCLSKEGSW
ncbi:hypothetical protein EVA_11126 [gut metagenome]|uniref:Uncharacterized protein n=1 Tax=gut metagenome TaxID=749906 RepID=J9G1P6_9ZZZZ